MADAKELDSQLETMYTGIKSVQEKIDTLNTENSETKEFAEKAAKDVTDAMEALQKFKQQDKSEEFVRRITDLEEELATKSKGDKDLQSEEYKSAMARYLRKGIAIPEDIAENAISGLLRKSLHGVEESYINREAKDLVSGSGSDGGHFLMADRSSRFIQRIFETSPVRTIANIETTTSDVLEYILDDDEADAGWVGETDARDGTATPKIGVVKIPLHEIYARPKVSQKIIDDAGFDIEGWLTGKNSRRIGRIENTSFVSGDGAQKPRGFLDYDNWTTANTYQRNAVERIPTASAGTLTADDVIKLSNSLIEDYQSQATFGMARETFTTMMQFKGTNGQYLLNPQVLLQGAQKILLGKDVVFLNDMSSNVTTAGQQPLVVADWQEFYTIVDRFDIRVLRDPYTLPPYIRYYTTKRTGGAVTNYEAGKILTISA